jgi:hypothetical protein
LRRAGGALRSDSVKQRREKGMREGRRVVGLMGQNCLFIRRLIFLGQKIQQNIKYRIKVELSIK